MEKLNKRIWFVDTEYNNNKIVCVCAEDNGGNTIEYWMEEIPKERPFKKGDILVSYLAQAEQRTFLRLGWKIKDLLWFDMFTEFKLLRNRADTNIARDNSLLDCVKHYGFPVREVLFKKAIRDRIIDDENLLEIKSKILEYCEDDVKDLKQVFNVWAESKTKEQFKQRLLREHAVISTSIISNRGIPVDMEMYNWLVVNRQEVVDKLIESIIKNFPIFSKIKGVYGLRRNLLIKFIQDKKYNWPLTDKGFPSTDKETLKSLAIQHPELEEFREVKKTIEQLKKGFLNLEMKNGRTYPLSLPFGTRTGRWSHSKFIFGGPKWWRYLVRTTTGKALIVADQSRQEVGIAALEGRDQNMWNDYMSGDIYQAIANRCGQPEKRNAFKPVVLGMQYSMGKSALAQQIGDANFASKFYDWHKHTYRAYWAYIDKLLPLLKRQGALINKANNWWWYYKPYVDKYCHTYRNWMIQSTGACILQEVLIQADRLNLPVIAHVHDSVVLECDIKDVEKYKLQLISLFEAANRKYLGYALKSDTKVYTDRYEDKDGKLLWDKILKIRKEIDDERNRNK